MADCRSVSESLERMEAKIFSCPFSMVERPPIPEPMIDEARCPLGTLPVNPACFIASLAAMPANCE